jgi:hypothetical protein
MASLGAIGSYGQHKNITVREGPLRTQGVLLDTRDDFWGRLQIAC